MFTASKQSKLSVVERVPAALVKTQMCKHLKRGFCRYGADCQYAHQAHELLPRLELRKTKLCLKFLAGCCMLDDCKYAHGTQELVEPTYDHSLIDHHQPAVGGCLKSMLSVEKNSPPGLGGSGHSMNDSCLPSTQASLQEAAESNSWYGRLQEVDSDHESYGLNNWTAQQAHKYNIMNNSQQQQCRPPFADQFDTDASMSTHYAETSNSSGSDVSSREVDHQPFDMSSQLQQRRTNRQFQNPRLSRFAQGPAPQCSPDFQVNQSPLQPSAFQPLPNVDMRNRLQQSNFSHRQPQRFEQYEAPLPPRQQRATMNQQQPRAQQQGAMLQQSNFSHMQPQRFEQYEAPLPPRQQRATMNQQQPRAQQQGAMLTAQSWPNQQGGYQPVVTKEYSVKQDNINMTYVERLRVQYDQLRHQQAADCGRVEVADNLESLWLDEALSDSEDEYAYGGPNNKKFLGAVLTQLIA